MDKEVTKMDKDESKIDKSTLQTSTQHQSDQFFIIFGGLALLLLLIRLGPLSAFLLIAVSFLFSALPEFRSIVDSTLGRSPPSQDRLRATFQSIANLHDSIEAGHSSSVHQSSNKCLTLPVASPDLSQIPPEIVTAFMPLIDNVMHDFIESWYLKPTISTGDHTFLNHLRSSFQHILVNTYLKISSKSSKETLVYLVGCLAMNLVRHIHDPPSSNSSWESKQARKSQRTLQVRRISEEILLTLGPLPITVSPIILSLLSEVLTVQLISGVNSLDDDWFNRTIITYLGPVTPTLIPAESSSEVESSRSSISSNPTENVHFTSASSNTRSSPLSSPVENSVPSVEPEDSLSITGQNLLNLYLKSTPDLLSNASARLPDPIPLLFQITPIWSPKQLSMNSPTTASLLRLQQSSHHAPTAEPFTNSQNPNVQSLVKIWTHLDSFRRISQITELETQLIKSDAISLLSSLIAPLDQAINALIDQEEDQATRHTLLNTWQFVVVETLRRLEDANINGALIFQNMQDWVLDRIQRIETDEPDSQHLSVNNMKDPVPKPHNLSRNGPTGQETREERISYMTIPHVPSMVNSSNSTSPPRSQTLPNRSEDISFSRPIHSETTNGRHQSSPSPSTPPANFSESPPSNLQHGRIPSQPPMSPLRNHSSFKDVPEEGDMADGFSFDDANDIAEKDHQPSPHHSLKNSHILSQATRSYSSDAHITPQSNRLSSQSHERASTESQTAPLSTFSVSVTDISCPTAFDPKGLIKTKRDLEFMIAVEVSGVPGFIVTRKWTELEKMDVGIGKLRLIGLGTKSFPRALLPTNLNFKTSDHLVREIEGYLAHLLNHERYAESLPVLNFFAKERSGSTNKGGLINPLGLGSLQSTWDTIGKGVVSVTKPVNMAGQGLSQLSKGVLAGLPFGMTHQKDTLPTDDEGLMKVNHVEPQQQPPPPPPPSNRVNFQDRLKRFSISATSSSASTSNSSLDSPPSIPEQSQQQVQLTVLYPNPDSPHLISDSEPTPVQSSHTVPEAVTPTMGKGYEFEEKEAEPKACATPPGKPTIPGPPSTIKADSTKAEKECVEKTSYTANLVEKSNASRKRDAYYLWTDGLSFAR
ncbi:uncharacterized protein MELLADRAFT_118197 [Melampsora larici-populina 98AG31]|uniref:PXA domain-containing protein n=1 Tax=Melampsora larici-populina (strain 98AG31 / pathotype 3-4-7) TaxID=747676 RepID=F4S658_MELLP|nr:uncharacterized protein MELLADRAFT_118197 [Melampsora larici-populina 98AG31]EGF99878.1 hypothetical protein MELLADRAFT_118197 [Melampsora larici-populina 98AG31]